MTVKYASTKQIDFLVKLLGSKEVSPALRGQTEALINSSSFTVREASSQIDQLIRLPRKTQVGSSPAVTEPGFYLSEGVVFRVQRTKDGQRIYAKQLVIAGDDFTWEYAPGALRSLTVDSQLTPAQAAEFGKLSGRCAYCGRKLEDDLSRQFYIGPVCSSKYLGIKRSRSKAAYAEARRVLDERAAAVQTIVAS